MKRAYPPFKALLALGLPAMLILPGCEGGQQSITDLEVTPEFAQVNSAASAIGSGIIYLYGERRSFSVSAFTKADGTTTGTWQITIPQLSFHRNYEVVCVVVQDNLAYIGGVTKDTNDPAFFKVLDTGKGKDAGPDQITATLVRPNLVLSEFCAHPEGYFEYLPFVEIESGSIQVTSN